MTNVWLFFLLPSQKSQCSKYSDLQRFGKYGRHLYDKCLVVLLASLTEESMSEILGLTMVREIWTALECTFCPSTQSRTNQLREELQFLKRSHTFITDFSRKFTGLCHQLAAIGSIIIEENNQLADIDNVPKLVASTDALAPSNVPAKTTSNHPAGDTGLRGGSDAAERLIVAVKAENVISNSGFAWALSHAAKPGDCITLLALFTDNITGGRRFWGFPRLKGDCRSGDSTKLADRISRIYDSCSQMVLQVQNQIQVSLWIKVVSITSAGAVAAESKSIAAKWVVLDKKLKRELKHCMDELRCNIVVMNGSHAKVHRLNLAQSNDLETPFHSASSSPLKNNEKLQSYTMKHTTPVTSPEDPNTSCTRTSGETSISSPDIGASAFVLYEKNPLYERFNENRHQPQNNTVDENVLARENCNGMSKSAITPMRTKSDYFLQYNKNDISTRALEFNQYSSSSIREVMSLSKASSTPPPLCSLCQFKAPIFGKPPKQFYYSELEEATDGFSDTNYVAEGGFGVVHRGVLRNGLVIAVKQLEFIGPQGDADFCQEVRMLSCAQHRNVVMLIGFCVEGKKRLLVYEYVCNNSLDFHLHGNVMPELDWQTRLKIATGTARGLRYLHEDCRVGCIIHRNLQPESILLTHDFEPLVADVGLRRLHNDWKFCDRNQVVKTSGYLAPEYFNDGKMTEKVDIYAYGLVLLELITGQRAHDLQYRMEHQFLLDNVHALPQGFPYELHVMAYVASLCLQQDSDLRPPMSKVVRMLEAGSSVTTFLALDSDSVGCRSGHMQRLDTDALLESKRRHLRRRSY